MAKVLPRPGLEAQIRSIIAVKNNKINSVTFLLYWIHSALAFKTPAAATSTTTLLLLQKY